MGMTIDKSITLLTDYLEWQKLHEMDGTGIDEATRNLIDVAKKYQKIQEIIKNTDVMTGSNGYARAFIKIKEVVKDGND